MFFNSSGKRVCQTAGHQDRDASVVLRDHDFCGECGNTLYRRSLGLPPHGRRLALAPAPA